MAYTHYIKGEGLSGTTLNVGATGSEILVASATGNLSQAGTALTATGAEINSQCDVSGRIVNLTDATLTIVAATHANRIITINRAAGSAITMLAASGSGNRYEFIVGTTVTSVAITFVGLTNSATYAGQIISSADDAASTGIAWSATTGDNLVTLDGSTQGGLQGDRIIFTDIATNLYHIFGTTESTGTEATPFSTAS